MKSGYRIDWADEALENLDYINDYLTIRWTNREVRNFYISLERTLKLILNNPLAFPASDLRSNVRRSVLSKQTTIYYEIKEESIEILSLFDNRRYPKSLKIGPQEL